MPTTITVEINLQLIHGYLKFKIYKKLIKAHKTYNYKPFLSISHANKKCKKAQFDLGMCILLLIYLAKFPLERSSR